MKPLKGIEIDETESWKSAVAGTITIQHYNLEGHLVELVIRGGSTVQVTPHERRINQERAADDTLDVFVNGMLTPVRLLDSEPETAELKANVNAMSETAMKALFRSQKPTFTKKVNEIGNIITLRRLLEVAEEIDASMAQYKIIQERVAEVNGAVSEATLTAGPEYGGKIKAVSPR